MSSIPLRVAKGGDQSQTRSGPRQAGNERCNARVMVDDGSGDGEQKHLGHHRDSERLGEVFGMFHVADERRDKGVPVDTLASQLRGFRRKRRGNETYPMKV